MTNPYVFINVSENAVKSQGHRMHRDDPNKIWKDGAWWNGTWYPAGSDRRDYINSFTDKGGTFVSLDGTIVTEAWCEAAPTGPIAVTPSVSSSNPCGTANDTFNVVADATKFGYAATGTAASGSVSILFTALPGYAIGGSNPVVLTFTNVSCPTPAGPPPPEPPSGVGATDVCPNLDGVQEEIPGGYDENCEPPTVQGTDTSTPKPDKKPEVKGTEAVPTAVAAGIGGNGPTMTGSSPMDLLAQMLVGGGLALLMAAGWLQIGRQTHGVHQA